MKSMHAMNLDDFFDCLFPGDEERGLPRFTECQINPNNHISGGDLHLFEVLLKQSLPLGNVDHSTINSIIRNIQKDDKALTDKILTALLEAYFSCERVIRVLRPDAVTLFPNHRHLIDINYDLLANVMDIKPNN